MIHLSLPLVVDAVAKASIILAATALVAAALRRASASARHLVWTLGLVSALAAPLLSVALPRWELPIVRVRSAVPAPRAELLPAPAGNAIVKAPALTRGATSGAATDAPAAIAPPE